MIKILKLILVVIFATLIGVWATRYHGYIMLVLQDKTIKMNLVAFVFVLVILFFLLIFAVRLIKLTFSFPYALFSWLMGLLVVNKKEKFTDLLADMLLENNRLIKKIGISSISRLTPKYLMDYVLFRKLHILVIQKDIKSLEKALKHIDSRSLVYEFFEVYKLYLVQKISDAQVKIFLLLERKNNRFLPNIVELAAKIAIADRDNNLAQKILNKYDAYLGEKLEEELIILALKKAENVNKLSEIYNKSDTTNILSRVYLEQLLKFEEIALAEKFAKKQLNISKNISPEMLKLYVNAFNIPISRLLDKVLKHTAEFYSILALLDLAMIKSDNHSFKMIYDYVERNVKDFLSNTELEKYLYILCKFFIKNGEFAGIDLSTARLVYRNN